MIKILSAIAASAGAIFLVGETANAIPSFDVLVTPFDGGNEFTYNITLDADDTISNSNTLGVPDALNFTNLVGVTGVTFGSNSPYQLVGFDATTVNLEVATTTSGATTIDNAVTIIAEAFPGEVDTAIEFSDNSSPDLLFTGVTGPAEEIPFQAEAGTAVIVLGMFVAGRTHWKRRQNR